MKVVLLAYVLVGAVQVSAQAAYDRPIRVLLLEKVLQELDATHRRVLVINPETGDEFTVIVTPEDVHVTPDATFVRPNIVGPEL